MEISKPEAGAPEGNQPHYEAHFVRASEDGTRVFFTSEGELTANDAGIHDLELYEYNTVSKKLTRISSGESGHEPGKVVLRVQVQGDPQSDDWDIVASADGSHVYFVSEEQLVHHPNAEGNEPKGAKTTSKSTTPERPYGVHRQGRLRRGHTPLPNRRKMVASSSSTARADWNAMTRKRGKAWCVSPARRARRSGCSNRPRPATPASTGHRRRSGAIRDRRGSGRYVLPATRHIRERRLYLL